jgi:hypothetical protein
MGEAIEREERLTTRVLAKDGLNVDNIDSNYSSSSASAESSILSFCSLSCAVVNQWSEVRAEYH